MNLTWGIGVLTNEDQIKFYIHGVLITETKQYHLIECNIEKGKPIIWFECEKS